jgi:hypothetical protein
MDDKEKYTDTATLRVAQRNISEPEYNIFWGTINLDFWSASYFEKAEG